MDGLDEAEIVGIWRRVKKYIPVNRIKGRNQREVLQNIETYMNEQGEVQGESGSMKTLVKNGFATEDGFGRTKEFQSHLDEWIEGEGFARGGGIESADIPEAPALTELPKLKMFSNGRVSVATRKGKRVYAQKNLRVSFAEFKGRTSYYVFNTRTKKRLTWGVLTDD